MRLYSGVIFAVGCCAFVLAGAERGAASGATRPELLAAGKGSMLPLESLEKSTTMLYVAGGGTGVHVFTESGHQTQVFAKSTGADSIAMDDAGDVFVGYTKKNLAYAARYAIGGTKPEAKYTPSTTGDALGYVLASHKGEVIWFRLHPVAGGYSFIYDVWDPGKSGPASRTFAYSNGEFEFALDNNGALYVPYYDPNSQTYRYDEIPAGASKPSRTIVEAIVTGPNAQSFTPSTMVALTDGTLYVGEYGYYVGDPFVGLYVYPAHGQERLVTNGAASPTAAAVDASENVYVSNSSFGYQGETIVCDTLHTLSTYSPGAISLLSQATSGFLNGQSLTVASNGTAFIDEFYQGTTCPNQVGIASVAPRASSGNQITNLGNQDVVLYDGTRATNPFSQALR